MRLIDVDKAENDIVENVTTKAVSRVVAILQGQPTVKAIPIDKPFLKMRYGDYVVYNKKWLVNHLQTEWNILQGKEYQPSIPVEWLYQKRSLYLKHECYMSLMVINEILNWWEKEHEKDI